MSTQTTNLGLVKPDLTDNADIAVLNQNADKIDEAVPFKFGIDAQGRYGYIKSGAASVTPFSSSEFDDESLAKLLLGDNCEEVTIAQNINLWSMNNPSAVWSNSYADGVNSITYTGGGGFERFISPAISMQNNRLYLLTFGFYSTTGFTFGGYDSDGYESFCFSYDSYPSGTNTAGHGFTKILGKSRPLSKTAESTAALYCCPYSYSYAYAGNRNGYFAFDLGYIRDAVQINITITNIRLFKSVW